MSAGKVARLVEAVQAMRVEMGDAKCGRYTVRWEMVAPVDAALSALTPAEVQRADAADAGVQS